MITKPYWTKNQIDLFELSFDEIERNSLTVLSIDHLSESGYKTYIQEANIESDETLIVEMVKYWAWKETWYIAGFLIEIKNPFRRLFTLMRWGFKNNRYLKMTVSLSKMQLPHEAKNEMDEVYNYKIEFLTNLFTDRGIPYESAKNRALTILPYYYGWAKDKEDHITSDIQKSNVLGIYKTMLFPELFKNERASVKEL